MIESYLLQASTYAGDIDNLILLITLLVGFWFILSEVVFFYLIIKFRRKDGVKALYVTGEEPEYKRWIHWPHWLIIFCDVFVIIGAVRVWYDVKQTLPPMEQTIRVIGQQWAWSFVHPGPDGKIDTADDIKTVDDLHVKVDTTYHFKLEARDVLHNFSVPVFRLKQDAIPGRVITGWFKANKAGDYDIQCAEICGLGHGIMAGRIHVENAAQHAAWIAEESGTATGSAFGE
ncbi:MAG: cytochrome c oxidase subunit II [bacterium]|nr:cytochrome c oxidase subunit II [bacterium]